MISSIRGEVLQLGLDHAVVEVSGSVWQSTPRPRH